MWALAGAHPERFVRRVGNLLFVFPAEPESSRRSHREFRVGLIYGRPAAGIARRFALVGAGLAPPERSALFFRINKGRAYRGKTAS